MSVDICTHNVLDSTKKLRSLTDEWKRTNKSRVYVAENPNECHATTTNAVSSIVTTTTTPTPVQRKVAVPYADKTNPYALASMRQVLASRQDLIDTPRPKSGTVCDTNANDHPGTVTTTPRVSSLTPNATQYVVKMANVENQVLTLMSDMLSLKAPPYSCSASMQHHEPVHTGVAAVVARTDIVPHACFAYISSSDSLLTHPVYLPITTPSPGQILNCSASPTYNKNVISNIADALSCKGIEVVMGTGDAQTHNSDMIYIDVSTPVSALGTPQCCEELLFGNTRITSSPEFCVGSGIGVAYASAIHEYQKYSNVAIGAHITLAPSSRKCMMQVVSMTCPELGMSHLVTGVSGTKTHPKFGPNHPTRIVDVMNEVAPFVRMCSESYMSIPTETVHDLHEDDAMPTPVSTKIEHCFAHNAHHGVSAYVGTHSVSLATGILNTYTCTTPFPMNKDITIHVAAIFGDMSTGRVLPSPPKQSPGSD
jgi:hypothetical protein